MKDYKEKYEIAQKILKLKEGDKIIARDDLTITWEYPNFSKKVEHYLDKGK